jgi:hypothetical protein
VQRDSATFNPLLSAVLIEAHRCYKQLWTVEHTFRTAKHLFSTRPIFHKLDETIRGHVFSSFLALVLKKELEDRIAALGRVGSWPEIIADLRPERDRNGAGRQALRRPLRAPSRRKGSPCAPQASHCLQRYGTSALADDARHPKM